MSGEIKHGLDEVGRAEMRQWLYQHLDDLSGAVDLAGLDDDQHDRIAGLVREIERELGRRP